MGHKEYEIGPAEFDADSIQTTRAAFGYYGSKKAIASKILESLPPHNAWVEAFCGSAAVTLAKRPAPIEVINDSDDHIVNLFEQLRNNKDALCRAVALTPYAKQEFSTARKDMDSGDALEKARRFLVAAMMTVNGTVGSRGCGFSFSNSYSRNGCEARVNRWCNLPDRLDEIAQRLRHVRVEKRDAKDLLAMFADRPATLVYLDPPYFTPRSHQYIIDANHESFHRELLSICNKCKCMILMSSYDVKLYNDLLTPENGWRKRKIETRTRGTSGKDHSRTEILWENHHFTKAAESGHVPIHLSEEEKKYNKINPSR